LDVASRIYFGIHHPIQYNVKVKEIGNVPPHAIPALIGNWQEEQGGDSRQSTEVTATADVPDMEDVGSQIEIETNKMENDVAEKERREEVTRGAHVSSLVNASYRPTDRGPGIGAKRLRSGTHGSDHDPNSPASQFDEDIRRHVRNRKDTHTALDEAVVCNGSSSTEPGESPDQLIMSIRCMY